VFTRERQNGHYGVLPFVLANTLSSLPFLLAIAVISSAISYFMARLHPGFSHYSFYAMILFVSLVVVESLMMAVAGVVPNFLMGIIVGASVMVSHFCQCASQKRTVSCTMRGSVPTYVTFKILVETGTPNSI
jgi:hypothetical protein